MTIVLQPGLGGEAIFKVSCYSRLMYLSDKMQVRNWSAVTEHFRVESRFFGKWCNWTLVGREL